MHNKSPLGPNSLKDYFRETHRDGRDTLDRWHPSAYVASREVPAMPIHLTNTDAQREVGPASHIRRKRYMSFRPLFVYRQLEQEARHSEEEKEAERLHSHKYNMEGNYEFFWSS